MFFLHKFQQGLGCYTFRFTLPFLSFLNDLLQHPPSHLPGLGDELVRWLGRHWARELFVTEGLRGLCLGCEIFDQAPEMEGSPQHIYPYMTCRVGWCEEMKTRNPLYQGMFVYYRYYPNQMGFSSSWDFNGTVLGWQLFVFPLFVWLLIWWDGWLSFLSLQNLGRSFFVQRRLTFFEGW